MLFVLGHEVQLWINFLFSLTNFVGKLHFVFTLADVFHNSAMSVQEFIYIKSFLCPMINTPVVPGAHITYHMSHVKKNITKITPKKNCNFFFIFIFFYHKKNVWKEENGQKKLNKRIAKKNYVFRLKNKIKIIGLRDPPLKKYHISSQRAWHLWLTPLLE